MSTCVHGKLIDVDGTVSCQKCDWCPRCETVRSYDGEFCRTCDCSPVEAAEWGRLLAEVDEWQRDAFRAWVAAGDYSHDGNGLPSVSDFEDAYAGEWDTFRQYADEFVTDIADVPDEIAAYFDWQAFARDLAYDYTTMPSPDGGVYIFRSY